MITNENWTYCLFKSEQFNARIAIGGEIGPNNQYLEIYYINKFLDDDLIYQETRSSLSAAIKDINTLYRHWDFIDQTAEEKTSGCSSCQAH